MRVLICDDSRFVLAALSHQLSGAGWQVAVAASGREAIERCRARRFDVVLLDLNMPGLDGPATRARLAELDGGGPTVIYLTGSPELAPDDAAGAVSKGDVTVIAAEVAAILGAAPTPMVDDPLAALAEAARVSLEAAAHDLARMTLAGETGSGAQDIAHRIAGSAPMFGAATAGEVAAALEAGLRSGRLSAEEAHSAARRIERLLA